MSAFRSRNPLYRAWYGMLHRCYAPTSRLFPYYGGRGITVCERWHVYEYFAADMGPKPAPGHKATLERLDNDGHYEPGNVVWATMKQQAMNTRQVRILVVDGIRDSTKGWAGRLGVSRQSIIRRIRLGWTAEKALMTPFKTAGRAELGVSPEKVWR